MMHSIYVGMLFSSYNNEFYKYEKYIPSPDEKGEGYYRQGKINTSKDKHVSEINLFNHQNLSFDDMLHDAETIRFDTDRYCDSYGDHRHYEMNRYNLKYTGSNADKFDRIDADDCYAIDLNDNGKVDEGEIFQKNMDKKDSEGPLEVIRKHKRIKPKYSAAQDSDFIPLDSELGRKLNRPTLECRQIDLEYEPVYSEPDALGHREKIGYRKRSKQPKWL